MSYQDRIYNQNNKFNRNSVGLIYNTSSDLCSFNKPKFDMGGADKINCKNISFNLSGLTFDDILTNTTECFYANDLNGSCFNNITWDVLIYEDDNLVESKEFFITNDLRSEVPTLENLTSSLNESFDNLNYKYSVVDKKIVLTLVVKHSLVHVKIR